MKGENASHQNEAGRGKLGTGVRRTMGNGRRERGMQVFQSGGNREEYNLDPRDLRLFLPAVGHLKFNNVE